MTADPKATQEIPGLPPTTSNVVPFTVAPHRITAESVVRHLLSQVDRIEDIVVVFRLKEKPTLMLNFSSDMNAVDLAIGGMTITELAKDKLNLLNNGDR